MNVRKRRVMRALVHYRNSAGLSMEEAAERSLCGVGTIHRMENGLNAVPLRVKTLLELYGAPPDVVHEMVQLAKDRDRSGIVRHYRDLISKTLGEYLELESEASDLSLLEWDLVHGLLQTEAYARAVISVSAFNPSESEIERLVELRMARQARFSAGNPPELVAVLGETALYNQVGGPKVLRAQLEHLQNLGKLPSVTIQVLPFTAGAQPASGTNFILLGFPDQADPDVVFTENLVGFSILEDAEDVRPFKLAFSRVLGEALSPRQSAKLISRAVADLSTS
ncbi:MAG TPA: helix-turn-helix transcriptional regulator [Actinophytocola sp.]|uniref:helix-turn-helix domain-containing protein n=1 Tax=Actinophytocola sp. TaxID=1872138 RepID=UPI002DBFD499|nr:helix-turn-helix transcriptional regulator [Actinophytocola sp.]HEU5471793.1 helix-turn-helix transcriptional regulator [Actinophytocola sp.]